MVPGAAGQGMMPGGMPGMVPGMPDQATMLARQRSNFDALEAQARARGAGVAAMQGMNVPVGMNPMQMQIPPSAAQRQAQHQAQAAGAGQTNIENVRGDYGFGHTAEEEMAEDEEISIRTLAGVRYRRNHEWMNEVFMYAAFGAPLSILEATRGN
jgi:hypothetical protein